jgi:hypothetical protein
MLPPAGPEPLLLYKQTGRKSGTRTAKRTREHDDSGKGARLVCARCRARITHERARTEVNGKHEHYFVNPHGYDYQIGCFSKAEGCIPHGKTSGEFSWFPGYVWQIDYCRSCSWHLGWMFRSPRHFFHGLIVDRIVVAEEPDDDEGES